MQSAEGNENLGNQLHSIGEEDPIDRALADLVGVTYQPHKKIVFLEGEQESIDSNKSGFDIEIIKTLFPNLAKVANLVPAKEKSRVERLHGLLEQAINAGKKDIKIFSIVDRDSEPIDGSANAFSWDRYHIENYLLEPKYILLALHELGFSNPDLKTEKDIKIKLVGCARETMTDLIGHDIENFANKSICGLIKTKTARKANQIASELRGKLEETFENMKDILDQELSTDELTKREKMTSNRFAQNLKNEDWVRNFRGREILKMFVKKNLTRSPPIHYEDLRRTILNRMREASFKPPGMEKIIQDIIDA